MINTLSYILFGLGVITAFLGFKVSIRERQNREDRRLFFYFSVASTWWSFFFSMVLNQTSEIKAYYWRSFGMVGVFAYLILGTFLMASWTEIHGPWKLYIKYFSLLGIFVFPLTVRPNAITFKMASFGMSYEFKGDYGDTIYSLYAVIIAIHMLLMICIMWKKSKRKRQKKMARQLIICELVIVFGMALDTIFPTLGIGAFPGSSLTQAVGVIMLYQVLKFFDRSQMTMDNFSSYIYYVLDTPVLLFDVDEKLKIVNTSATKFLHLPLENFENFYLGKLFHVNKDALSSTTDSCEIEAKCNTNNAYCKLNINRIVDEYGDTIGYIVAVQDLTDKMNSITQLGEERLRADEANKAKSMFLAKISHEIRTPINAVLGMDEMIIREADSEAILKYAMDIKSAGKSLLSIVNDILDFSKIESGKMELIEAPYDLGSLINDLKNIINVKAEDKGLELCFSVSETVPFQLFGDEVRLRQIISNLLDNAVKYTEKGSVTLSLDWEAVDDDILTLIVQVKDTGIGIREEDIEHLFEVFQRLDEKKNHSIVGSGLGLSIVQKFVELMHGEITVQSQHGEGSIFAVRIKQKVLNRKPLGPCELVFSRLSSREISKVAFTTPSANIMVVDDNFVNLSVIKGLLKRTKANVDTLTSGTACLERVKEKHYDLIFLDHMMPDMDGLETLTHLKEMNGDSDYLCHDVPVIALTANAILGVREMYIAHGFTDYLSKPIQSEELDGLLLKYLDISLIEKEESTR